jgi:acetolactate synthase-1/2/3 large subunit
MPPSVAAVVVDGLVRAGVARVFTHAGAGLARLESAVRLKGLAVVETTAPATACLLAAVSGEVGVGPGVALLGEAGLAEAAAGLDYAGSSRAPMIVVSPAGAGAPGAGGLKGRATLTQVSAAHEIAHALRLALAEPRGPVQVAVDDALAGQPAVPVATAVRPPPPPPADAQALDEMARRLGHAARPVLVVGMAARADDVAKWLRPLAETLPAPVLVTPRARGVLPDPHPLNLGPVSEGAALLARADLVVALGVEAQEAVPRGWPPDAPVLHLGPLPSARPDWTPAVQVVGDLALIIEELAPRLRGRSRADWNVAELDRLKRGRTAIVRGPGLDPERVVAIAREVTRAGTIAAADGGRCEAALTAAWAAVGPYELLVPGPAGPPSFAVAAALASQLACPDRRALAFADAAGLAPDDDALAVAARVAAPIVVIALGPPGAGDPLGVAAGLGLAGVPAAAESALAPALVRALAARAPSVIDARSAGAWRPPV